MHPQETVQLMITQLALKTGHILENSQRSVNIQKQNKIKAKTKKQNV